MNNEIKETVRRMNDLIYHRFDDEYHTECDLFEDIQCLLDYITNLQEENKRLRELDENYPIEEQLEEVLKEINLLNYKINKLDEYLHKMLNATKGKYHQAIQETIWFLNMLKEYKGEDK